MSQDGVQRRFTVDGSRFCQLNCCQEALIPVLRTFPGLADYPYPRLHLIAWSEALAAVRADEVPGLVGGLSQERMAAVFAIDWRRPDSHLPPADAVRGMLRHGPILLHVDRFDLPADERWYRRGHRPHTILAVSTGREGIDYLDSDHAVVPALLPWAVFETSPSISVFGVASARAPDDASLHDRFQREAATLLSDADGAAPQLVSECLDRVVGAAPTPARRTTGLDPIAFLNGVGQSLATVADATRLTVPAAAADLDNVVEAVSIACRRLMLLLNSDSAHRRDNAEAACDVAAGTWSALRPARVSALVDALATSTPATMP